MKKKNKLFELLVVGGGLWITGCGGQTHEPLPQSQTPTAHRTLADGGVPDTGDGGDVVEGPGGGSGFW